MAPKERSTSQDSSSTHTMGRSRSPSPTPESRRSKSPLKNDAYRVQKNDSKQDPKIASRLQDITTEEFMKLFKLQDDRIKVFLGLSSTPAYHLPRKFICEKSGYFATEHSNKPRTIFKLDFEAPDAFEVILQSMFTDKITLPDYESQLKPAKAMTKYLDIIKMTSLLDLHSDLLARNAASVVWRLVRNHPTKIRDKHLKTIFGEAWPKGWAFDNVRKEFVKEMAEEWINVAVGAASDKERKYDLEKVLKRDGEVTKLVLVAVRELLGKRAWNTGVHPLTGRSLVDGNEAGEDAEMGDCQGCDESEEVEEVEEIEEVEEVGNIEEPEVEPDYRMKAMKDVKELGALLVHFCSENGRYWETVQNNVSHERARYLLGL